MAMDIVEQLQRHGRLLRRGRLARRGLRWLAATLGLWLLWFWLDNLLRLPAGMRLAMLAAGIGLPLWRAWEEIVRPLCRGLRPERTARELEERCGIGDNALINACLFARRPPAGAGQVFAAAAIAEGAARARAISPETLRDGRPLRRLGLATGAAVLLWALYAAALSRHAGNAMRRFARPLADIPPVGDVTLSLLPAGTVSVWEGDSLTVTAVLRRVSAAKPADIPPPRLRRAQRSGPAGSAEELEMLPDPSRPECHTWRFENIMEPFSCRAASGDNWSPATSVQVRRLPRLTLSTFELHPPAYAGVPPALLAGPPASLSALPGSRVRVTLELDREPAAVEWRQAACRLPLTRLAGRRWRGEATVEQAGDYTLLAADGKDEPPRPFVRGTLLLLPDRTPEVAFATDDRNRLLWPGEELVVPVEAADDFGLKTVRVTVSRASEEAAKAVALAQWPYQGPPGRKGKVRERLALRLEAARFEPGESYRFDAWAEDWRPGGETGRSAPLIVRLRHPGEAADILAGATRQAAAAIEQAVAEQRRALGLTRNLETHLEEALAAGHIPAHRQGIQAPQERARRHGRTARAALTNKAERAVADRLEMLVEQEMGLALAGIAALEPPAETAAMARRAARLAERQKRILDALLDLLGRLAAQTRSARDDAETPAPPPPAPTRDELARDLHELLGDFTACQKRIVEQSRTLLERGPEDLTEEELEVLGRLAWEEAGWAAMLRDKLDDIARNPLQDFADGSLAEEFNEIFQEVRRAAEALYARNIEMAVPLEQSGLENAAELLHNLERWLTDKPDFLKWLMEEPAVLPDAPLAELPRELEDIVGELLDREEAMTEEVEDVTSGWIDSLDKGAGWDAMDGPISSMGAKGVTGNQLPNRQEIGGRAGEGRAGRSQGQMVEAAAEGKEGRRTPARLTPTPFEDGAVDDRSRQSPGGATGGGKLAGFAGQGMRGPAPPPRLAGLQRLAGRQSEIRQAAERLNLHLRACGAPSGDLDAALAGMREFEALAAAGRGGEIRRAFDATLASMRSLRRAVAAEAATRRERGALPRAEAEELWSGLRDDMPPGYEEIVAAYYRRLAESAARRQER